jgi:DNA-binding HxlR family transcriptional regulator
MRGRKKDLSRASCAVARSLDVVGDWWSLLIVRDALLGAQRFGEFQKSIGLAKNILSSRLKKLVGDGILRLQDDPDFPSVHRYVLTERGRQLAIVIMALWQWGEDHCFRTSELGLGLADDATGKMLGRLNLTTADGHRVDPNDLRMVVRMKPEVEKRKPSRALASSRAARPGQRNRTGPSSRG